MIKELTDAGREICARLRAMPYQPRVTITAWSAVIDQLLDDKRYGAFSWRRAVSREVERYIASLDDATKHRIWDSTEDRHVIPNASMETITKCLYPFVHDAAMRPIYRAVQRQERKREANTASHGTALPRRP